MEVKLHTLTFVHTVDRKKFTVIFREWAAGTNWLMRWLTLSVCLSILPPLQIVNHLTDFHENSYDPYDGTCHVWEQVTININSAITWYCVEFQKEIVWSNLRLCTRSLSKAVRDFTASLPLIASALSLHRSPDVTSYGTSAQVFFSLSKVLPDWVSLLEVTKTVCFFLPV